MKTALKTIIALSALSISLNSAAKITDGQKYGDWQGVCQADKCGVIQTVNDSKGQPIGQILIRKVAEAGNAPAMFVSVPLGMNLRAGIIFTVDGKDLGALPYEFCTAGGCNSIAPLKGEELAKIKAGNTLTITVTTFAGQEQKKMSFSLKGVTSAINAL